jgi:hypothetical protein
VNPPGALVCGILLPPADGIAPPPPNVGVDVPELELLNICLALAILVNICAIPEAN